MTLNTTPTLPGPMPGQNNELQYPTRNIPAPMAGHHQMTPQNQMQNQIRLMIETELVNSRFSPLNTGLKHNQEAASRVPADMSKDLHPHEQGFEDKDKGMSKDLHPATNNMPQLASNQ